MQKSVFDEMEEMVNDVLETVLNEFLEDEPTTILQTDFDVQLLKFSVAHKSGRIDKEQVISLTLALCDVERIWRKLNDIK